MDQSRFRHLSATLAGSLFCRDSWSHAAVILTFGAVLGVGFNSANPNGVAWRLPASKAASADPVRPPTALLPGSASAEQPAAPPPHCMSWEQLALRVSQNTALAVDLRSAADYQAGHVPKAVSCPLENLGADLDSPAWQTFRARAHVHHYVVLYGAEQPTDAMQRFRGRLVEELGYAMVMFATDGYRGWEARQTERKARIADSESKARDRMKAQAAVPPEARVAAVTYAQAAALPDALWIDSRPRSAFDAAHIPGAISIPEGSDKAVLDRLRAEQSAERPIVVYCSGIGCGTSRRLATRLAREFGFTRVHHLPGGFTEWQQIQAAQAASEENLP